MIGLGTTVNAVAVIVGGLLGLCIRGGLRQRFQEIIMQVLGLVTIFIGVSGTLKEMLVIEGGTISTQGTTLAVIALVIGALLGEWWNLEKHIEHLGEWLKVKVKSENDIQFVDGFVSTSLIICVGAMAVVGALEDGLRGDCTMLFTKAILDLIVVLVCASIFGKGAIFSVIPLILWQGSITLLARAIEPWLSVKTISDLSLVGNMLIFCVGINLMFKAGLRVANMLPSLIIVLIYGVFAYQKSAVAISVIGGADGPTSIFVAGRLATVWYVGIAVFVLLIISIIITVVKRNK